MQRFIGTILLVTTFAILNLTAESAEEIVNKYYEAIGGKEKLESISNWVLEGKSKLGTAPEGDFKYYYKPPDKIKVITVIHGNRIIQAVDGEKGWELSPPQGIKVPADLDDRKRSQILAQRNLVMGPFYNYKEKGAEIDYKGKVNREGKEYYKLILNNESKNISVTIFLDSETYLINIIETVTVKDGKPITLVNLLSNYKEIKGMKIPFSYKTMVGGNVFTDLQLDNVKINEEIDDGIFEKPEIPKNHGNNK